MGVDGFAKAKQWASLDGACEVVVYGTVLWWRSVGSACCEQGGSDGSGRVGFSEERYDAGAAARGNQLPEDQRDAPATKGW